MAAHETFLREEEGPKGSSERSFGLLFAAVFAIAALLPLRRHLPPRYWSLGAGAGFLIVAIAAPKALRPLNFLWTRLSVLLSRIVTPVVMAVLFYGVLTPAALLLRIMGKDPLNRRFDRAARSYWTARPQSRGDNDSMRHQF